ncbi:hypothetical protein Ssi02_60600 [Sinosporangium siamense]|uniref:Uncharacterized protein n=1 Tax=Sinosporangium siamense TaxID=1367973 RepID=A0A919RPJ8_9ACTN|nr:hypothetical protein Ssi02_60600 [Sinosporangium siamense]
MRDGGDPSTAVLGIDVKGGLSQNPVEYDNRGEDRHYHACFVLDFCGLLGIARVATPVSTVNALSKHIGGVREHRAADIPTTGFASDHMDGGRGRGERRRRRAADGSERRTLPAG